MSPACIMLRLSVFRSLIAAGALLCGIVSVSAQGTPSFKDLPATHAAFEAVEYLRARGVIAGFPDGTFRPGDGVTRDQAIKIIIAPMISAEQLAALTSTPFSDVPSTHWSKSYVEAARLAGVIDGPPKATLFHGARGVSKVEFLKMMMLAYQLNAAAENADVKLPLAPDAANAAEWFYPYVRASIATSMDTVTADGLLQPAKALTRADVCVLLYRYLMYQEGRRVQAGLYAAETDIVNTLQFLESGDISQAEFASARSLLFARGAASMRKDDPLVQAALKLSQSFRSLVRAFRAGVDGKYDETITLAGEAWNLAGQAAKAKPDLRSVAEQVQVLAKTMADNARQAKAGG